MRVNFAEIINKIEIQIFKKFHQMKKNNRNKPLDRVNLTK